MRNRIIIAALYADAYQHRAKQAAIATTYKIVEYKSELTCIAGTAAVVGVVARVAGFKAGYKFAKTSNLATAV